MKIIMVALALGVALARGAVSYDAKARVWTLTSGEVDYRLAERDGTVSLSYFGPVGRSNWPEPLPRLRSYPRFDLGGQVAGQRLVPEELELVAQHPANLADHSELELVFRHRHLALEVIARYATCGDTGVITRELTLRNTGASPLALESSPSLAWLLPPGEYSLDYLHGGWGEERQLTTEKIAVGRREFANRTGRASNGYSPWFCVRDETHGVRYAAQLAYSGDWQMSFEPYTERRRIPLAEQDVWIEMGLRHDFGGPARLGPGESITLPRVAFTASAGDRDAITNQLHRYQRRFVMPALPNGAPLVTQFNTWTPLGRTAQIGDIKKYVDLAAELGLEAFGTDAAWVVKTNGKTLFGDWRPDPQGLPHGLRELADYVHAKGLKFCVWLEPESTSKYAPMAVAHPDWILQYNGVPMEGTFDRVYWDFQHPEVRTWIRSVVDGLVREGKVDWLKLDYNADVGERFDPAGTSRSGLVLHEHLRQLYSWLDSIRSDYPQLILENCSSGSLRADLALLQRTHFTWLSDVTDPRASVQLAYGGTVEFAPEACFHWMSGDDARGHVDESQPRGWWDFMFRVAMNGPFAISSAALEWSPAMRKCAAENIALYKRLRSVIAGADVYHLTPPPAAGDHPSGWAALEYVSSDGLHAALMTYRLGQSEPRQVLRLRGLNPVQNYLVTRAGGEAVRMRGAELAETGLMVVADAEWRAPVFEITADVGK